jgi:hypothetical protein
MGRAIQHSDIAYIVREAFANPPGAVRFADSVAFQVMARIRELDPCYGKAAADEPIFVLKASDELAPDAVACWSAFASALPPESRRRQSIPEAQQCILDMLRWKEEHSEGREATS